MEFVTKAQNLYKLLYYINCNKVKLIIYRYTYTYIYIDFTYGIKNINLLQTQVKWYSYFMYTESKFYLIHVNLFSIKQ